MQVRKPLQYASMLGGARQAARGRGAISPPLHFSRPERSPLSRIEALVKLKELLDSGVLTGEQYASERERLVDDR
ncbi:MAG: hypothetical protein ACOYD4_03390 [Solirubrobacterales bacterium]